MPSEPTVAFSDASPPDSRLDGAQPVVGETVALLEDDRVPLTQRAAEVRLDLEVEAQHANLQHLDLQNTPGIGVVVRTSAKTDDEARLLLSALRPPGLNVAAGLRPPIAAKLLG